MMGKASGDSVPRSGSQSSIPLAGQSRGLILVPEKSAAHLCLIRLEGRNTGEKARRGKPHPYLGKDEQHWKSGSGAAQKVSKNPVEMSGARRRIGRLKAEPVGNVDGRHQLKETLAGGMGPCRDPKPIPARLRPETKAKLSSDESDTPGGHLNRSP